MAAEPETRRLLLELVYGLLSEDEAAELRRRIESDAELAAAYAEAQAAAGLFAASARLVAPPISLKRPGTIGPPPLPEPARLKPASRAAGPATAPWERTATWSVAAAASILVVFALSGYAYHLSRLSGIAADHLRLQVLGPSRLQAGAPNRYLVSTTSINGTPVSAQVDFSLYSPEGKLLVGHKEKTNAQGQLPIVVPASAKLFGEARMDLVASLDGAAASERIDARLPVAPPRYQTYLSLSQPVYRVGEQAEYRSVTLARRGLAAAPDMPVRFDVSDASAQVLADSAARATTSHGVANGEYLLHGELADDGPYTLRARSLNGSFDEAARKFLAETPSAPGLKAQLELGRDDYAPGDTVSADFAVRDAGGAPAAGAPLEIAATVNGRELYRGTGETSASGTSRIEFPLPEQATPGDGRLAVTVESGGVRNTAVAAIPIRRGDVQVDFFPEGGQLVAGLENRVYFQARDRAGKPLALAGRVVDREDNDVALAQTVRDGMGTLVIRPLAGEEYRLAIDAPAGIAEQPVLPAASAGEVVLNTGVGVFGPDKPLEFNVRAAKAGVPLVASACARGIEVGCRALVTEANANSVAIPLDPDVGGVIRLTIYDYRTSPPVPLAQRLVYRRPARWLRLTLTGQKESYLPGEQADLSLRVTDENDKPAPATLGVAVVDQSVFAPGQDAGPGLSTHFFLASELENPLDLENADLCLADTHEAAVAMDLLLGTRGWRPLERRPSPVMLAGGQWGDASQAQTPAATRTDLGGTPPPAMFDNLARLQERYQASLESYRQGRDRLLTTLATIGVFGGLGLLLLAALVNLLRIASGVRIWVPAIGAAAVCLILGMIVHPPQIGKSPQGAVAFAPYQAAPAAAPASAAAGERQAARSTGSLYKKDAATADADKREHLKEKEKAGKAGIEGGEDFHTAVTSPAAQPQSLAEEETAAPGREPLRRAGGLEGRPKRPAKPAEPRPVPAVQAGPAAPAAEMPAAQPPAEAAAEAAPALEPAGQSAEGMGYQAPGQSNAPPGAKPAAPRGPGLAGAAASQPTAPPATQPAPPPGAPAPTPPMPGAPGPAQAPALDMEGPMADQKPEQPGAMSPYYSREQQEQQMPGGGPAGPSSGRPSQYGAGTGGGLGDLMGQAGMPAPADRPEVEDRDRGLMMRQQKSWRALGAAGLGRESPATVLWSPLLAAGSDGRAPIRFALPGEPATLCILADAHTADGRIGSYRGRIAARLPLRLECRLPAQVTAGDRIDLPVMVANTGNGKLSVEVAVECGHLLRLQGEGRRTVELAAGEETRTYFPIQAVGPSGLSSLVVRAAAGAYRTLSEHSVEVLPPGFPQVRSYSGRLSGPQELTADVPADAAPGSLEVSLRVFPSMVSELEAALAGLAEASDGSLEHAAVRAFCSMSILQQLDEHGIVSPELRRQAKAALRRSYADLLTFRSPGPGFGRFAGGPAEETATALALLELRTMSGVGSVDAAMVDRSADWLVGRLTPQGSFSAAPQRKAGPAAGQDVVDAYVTWALVESGQPGMELALRHVAQLAQQSGDPYRVALAASALLASGKRNDAQRLLDKLAALQAEDGHLDAQGPSITAGGAQSLRAETTALAALAWLKAGMHEPARRAVDWLLRSRNAAGGFGSPQATLLALAALTEYDKINPPGVGQGRLTVFADDAPIAEQSFAAGRVEAVSLTGLESQLSPGEHRLRLALEGADHLPYLLGIAYRTPAPPADDACPLRLATRLSAATLKAGQPVTLTAELTNTTDQPQPMPVAVIGLPAGLEASPESLEQLRKSGAVDFIEVRGRELRCSWRVLAPKQKVELKIDLAAAPAGSYTGPASWAYLSGTPEHKGWAQPLAVVIARP